MNSRHHYICTNCNSTNIMHDAWAQWNPTKHSFELVNVYDDKFCAECETSYRYLEPTPIAEEVE